MDNKLHMSGVTLVVTLRCSLQCKLCAVHVPYYDTSPHYSLKTLTTTINNFFNVVDSVDKFTLNGGEAFMHPELGGVLDALSPYLHRIGLLELLTNSTILPKEPILEKLHNYKVDVLLNDYGSGLSVKIPELVEAFKKHDIPYRLREQNHDVRHFGGWVDISDLSLKDRSKNDTKVIFSKCAYPTSFHTFAIFGDKAYICGVYKRCSHIGLFPDNPDEYVDFSNLNTDSLETTKQKIINFYRRDYFSSCLYCDGFCSDSLRFEPAVQL